MFHKRLLETENTALLIQKKTLKIDSTANDTLRIHGKSAKCIYVDESTTEPERTGIDDFTKFFGS